MGGESYPGEERLREDWASFDRREGGGGRLVTMRSVFQMVKDVSVEQVLRRLPPVNEPETAIGPAVAGRVRVARGTGRTRSRPPPTTPDPMPSSLARDDDAPAADAVVHQGRPLPKGSLSMMFGDSTSGKSFPGPRHRLRHRARHAVARAQGQPRAGDPYVVAEGAGSFGKRTSTPTATTAGSTARWWRRTSG